MRFGDFELISLSDGGFRLDGGAMFGVVPKPLWERRTAPDEKNRISLAMRPLFVRTPEHRVIIDGAVRPRFPNARYKIRRDEYIDATHPHERNRASYFAENFVPLVDAGVVDFIEEDGEVLPGISVWRTGGHTMHHQLIKIQSGGRTAVFAADLMPTTAHVDEPWIMAYDLYPMDTLAYKRAFVREAIDGEYVIFFEHDPAVAAGIIREQDGKRFVESLCQ